MSDLERPILKSDFDNMPRETYQGLGYPTHRFADFIPVADGADQFALRESIGAIGLIDPIMLFEGAILDGRHRYAACVKVGVEPRFVEFEGDEEAALSYVLAKNIARRNLTTVQKLNLRDKLTPEIERLRAKAAENQAGGASVSRDTKVDVLAQTAEMVGLGRATVARADAVKAMAEDNPEVQDFLEDMLAGNIGIKTAYDKAKQVSTSDALDALAKKDSSKVDTNKQRATLLGNINKAHDLLINWDPGLLEWNDAAADKLSELVDWCAEAYNHASR